MTGLNPNDDKFLLFFLIFTAGMFFGMFLFILLRFL